MSIPAESFPAKTVQARVDGARDALLATLRDVPDFPSPGILFKDIAPTLANGPAFAAVIDGLLALVDDLPIDAVAGIESRGFLVGAPIALHRGSGLILVRKAGKLPGPTRSIDYALEYGSATLEIQADACAGLPEHPRVLVVDDVLATGGTMAAAADLLTAAGAEVVGLLTIMELSGLRGPVLDRFDVRYLAEV